jgi:hypothetical protein
LFGITTFQYSPVHRCCLLVLVCTHTVHALYLSQLRLFAHQVWPQNMPAMALRSPLVLYDSHALLFKWLIQPVVWLSWVIYIEMWKIKIARRRLLKQDCVINQK